VASQPPPFPSQGSSFCARATGTHPHPHAAAMVNHAAIASRLGVPLNVVVARFGCQPMMRQFSVKELKVISSSYDPSLPPSLCFCHTRALSFPP